MAEVKGKAKRKPNFAADHITPVVPLEEKKGFTAEEVIKAAEAGMSICDLVESIKPGIDWNVRINNLFTELDGWQAICHDCHRTKTNEENTARREFKKRLKDEQS